MPALTIVGLSGSINSPSRSLVLVEALLNRIATRIDANALLFNIADVELGSPALIGANGHTGRSQLIIDAIQSADLLVVGTPIYRGSYTGAFKHVFDLVSQDALAGKPVVLSATGGSALHGLAIEHQLRPLFSFFGAHTVPTGVYATESDFKDYRIVSRFLLDRIDKAASEAAILAEALIPAAKLRKQANGHLAAAASDLDDRLQSLANSIP